MRVAVFRAKADGRRTARRLEGLGFESLLAPVMRIVPTGTPLPTGQPDALVFTSAHGVEAVANDPSIPSFRDRPCFCVGARTAADAQDLGMRDARSAMADAERLCALLMEAIPPGSAVLFVTGRDRKPIVETRLRAAGYLVTGTEVYDAQAVIDWPEPVVTAFQAGQVEAGLHYSRRSADLVLEAARHAGCTDAVLRVAHHCLSKDAAEPLRHAGARRIVEAARPDEETLLGTLQRS